MIRRAVLEDVPRLAEMAAFFVSNSSYAAFVTPSQEVMRQSFGNLVAAPTGICFVLEIEGAVQGAILGLVTPHLMMSGAVAVEVGWWVEPAHRGRNGLELFQAYEQAVRASGVAMSILTCPPDGAARVGEIYERNGYRKMEATYMRVVQ